MKFILLPFSKNNILILVYYKSNFKTTKIIDIKIITTVNYYFENIEAK